MFHGKKDIVSPLATVLLLLSLLTLFPVSVTAQERIRLWQGSGVKAKSVTLDIYLPRDAASPTPAVIVCPGGSYCWHDRETEGTAVARWLQSNGIAAFVLNYRVQGIFQYVTHSRLIVPGRQHPMPLQDIQMALHTVRSNARRWNILPQAVGAMGFSAGGHLVMSAAEFHATDFLTPLGITVTASLRPDFVAPIYPVVTMAGSVTHKRSRRALLGETRKYRRSLRDSLSLERHVPQDCPPVFLVNCKDDPVVHWRNAVLLDSALTQRGTPHRYIQYPTGGHGFGASETKGTAECRRWKDEFIRWISTLLTECADTCRHNAAGSHNNT